MSETVPVTSLIICQNEGSFKEFGIRVLDLFRISGFEVRTSCAGRLLTAIAIFISFSPDIAMAHVESGEAGGFLDGVSHPVSGLDHVLAMVAVGLWGAQLGRPAVWLLPIAFPMMMAFGGMLGLMGVPVPGVEIGIAVSGVVLGAMVLGEVKAPLAASIILVGIFAIFHGHAHGTELPPGQNAMLYSLGFVISTGLLHAAGIGIGTAARWKAGRMLLRCAGAGVMIGGLIFLWSALA